MVEISIGPFVLGESFSQCYQKAKLDRNVYLFRERCDSLHNEITFSIYDKELSVSDVYVSAYKDTITQMLYNIKYDGDPASQKWADEKVLNYHTKRYGKVKPIKKPWMQWKQDKHRKYTSYNYDWSFENGYISICQRTHYLIPFKEQTSYDGLTVLYGKNNCSRMAIYYDKPIYVML